MNTIGIDFGTSFCTAAWINPKTSKPEPITFYGSGKQKMPSVVFYSKNEITVGEAAYAQLENSYCMGEVDRDEVIASLIQDIKRNMQQGHRNYLPDGRCITDEEIITDILKYIKKDVETGCFNEKSIEKTIITHPVSFQHWQKEMIKKAAFDSGFKFVELLEEPVAAAMGYASTMPDVGKGILVYDFGGGTFDVAFVHKDEDGYFRVPVPPEGDPYCGGNDIDLILYDLWESEAKAKYNRTICSIPGRVDVGFIARCRRQKETLSMREFNEFNEPLPPPNFDRVKMTIHRNDLNQQISPIIDKTVVKTERLLKKIKDEGYNIDTAVLIGGSSRIPLVYEKLRKILPVEPHKTMQVDVAVALGAVLHDQVKSNPTPASTKVFCIYCGLKMSSDDKFCIKCGKPNISFKQN